MQEFPTTETMSPGSVADVPDMIRSAHDAKQAIYTIGGGTSLEYGVMPTRTGYAFETTGLSRVVDYTPRDMTIVVEAGVRFCDLVQTLAVEKQQLPIDAPRATEATIGGLVASDWSGPRRYGYGTLRDYVIGINAVDGQGVPFKGGGRVVKNVAGYDFCKLLTGSLGTLGIITQLTFKLKPQSEQAVTLLVSCENLDVTEQVLVTLVDVPSPPAAIDLLVGTGWKELVGLSESAAENLVAVRFEGSETEVAAMRDQLQAQLVSAGSAKVSVLDPSKGESLLARQIEFSDCGIAAEGDSAPLTVKITALPSAVTQLVSRLIQYDPDCTIQAHAGTGVIIVRFAKFQASDLTTFLVGQLRPAAIQAGGGMSILSSEIGDLTSQIVWGGRVASSGLMEQIKQKFDPQGILNPGRFIFQA